MRGQPPDPLLLLFFFSPAASVGAGNRRPDGNRGPGGQGNFQNRTGGASKPGGYNNNNRGKFQGGAGNGPSGSGAGNNNRGPGGSRPFQRAGPGGAKTGCVGLITPFETCVLPLVSLSCPKLLLLLLPAHLPFP